MYRFSLQKMVHIQLMDMMEEKPQKKKENSNKINTRLVTLYPTHPIYKREADYFPVSEETEKKPEFPSWGRKIRLKGQRKCRVERSAGNLYGLQKWEWNYELQDLQKKWDWIKDKGTTKNGDGEDLGD